MNICMLRFWIFLRSKGEGSGNSLEEPEYEADVSSALRETEDDEEASGIERTFPQVKQITKWYEEREILLWSIFGTISCHKDVSFETKTCRMNTKKFSSQKFDCFLDHSKTRQAESSQANFVIPK